MATTRKRLEDVAVQRSIRPDWSRWSVRGGCSAFEVAAEKTRHLIGGRFVQPPAGTSAPEA